MGAVVCPSLQAWLAFPPPCSPADHSSPRSAWGLGKEAREERAQAERTGWGMVKGTGTKTEVRGCGQTRSRRESMGCLSLRSEL